MGELCKRRLLYLVHARGEGTQMMHLGELLEFDARPPEVIHRRAVPGGAEAMGVL